MKKTLLVVLCLILTLSCVGILAACGDKHEHEFATTWSKDAGAHWYAATCEHTDLSSNRTAHTWGSDGKCTVCQYEPAKPHEHEFATAWSKDEVSHWHVATCDHKTLLSDKADHSWGEDDKCTVCQQSKPIPVDPAEKLKEVYALYKAAEGNNALAYDAWVARLVSEAKGDTPSGDKVAVTDVSVEFTFNEVGREIVKVTVTLSNKKNATQTFLAPEALSQIGLVSQSVEIAETGIPKIQIWARYASGRTETIDVTSDMIVGGNYDFTKKGEYGITIQFGNLRISERITVGGLAVRHADLWVNERSVVMLKKDFEKGNYQFGTNVWYVRYADDTDGYLPITAEHVRNIFIKDNIATVTVSFRESWYQEYEIYVALVDSVEWEYATVEYGYFGYRDFDLVKKGEKPDVSGTLLRLDVDVVGFGYTPYFVEITQDMIECDTTELGLDRRTIYVTYGDVKCEYNRMLLVYDKVKTEYRYVNTYQDNDFRVMKDGIPDITLQFRVYDYYYYSEHFYEAVDRGYEIVSLQKDMLVGKYDFSKPGRFEIKFEWNDAKGEVDVTMYDPDVTLVKNIYLGEHRYLEMEIGDDLDEVLESLVGAEMEVYYFERIFGLYYEYKYLTAEDIARIDTSKVDTKSPGYYELTLELMGYELTFDLEITVDLSDKEPTTKLSGEYAMGIMETKLVRIDLYEDNIAVAYTDRGAEQVVSYELDGTTLTLFFCGERFIMVTVDMKEETFEAFDFSELKPTKTFESDPIDDPENPMDGVKMVAELYDNGFLVLYYLMDGDDEKIMPTVLAYELEDDVIYILPRQAIGLELPIVDGKIDLESMMG